jgi:hypothetical protein
MNKTVTNIVIKNYQEFTEEIEIAGEISVNRAIIAKEIEAVVQVEGEQEFSLGFSLMRDNPIFEYGSPRRMVQKFLLDNFKFNIELQS